MEINKEEFESLSMTVASLGAKLASLTFVVRFLIEINPDKEKIEKFLDLYKAHSDAQMNFSTVPDKLIDSFLLLLDEVHPRNYQENKHD